MQSDDDNIRTTETNSTHTSPPGSCEDAERNIETIANHTPTEFVEMVQQMTQASEDETRVELSEAMRATHGVEENVPSPSNDTSPSDVGEESSRCASR